MSARLIVGTKCTLAASYAVPWCHLVSHLVSTPMPTRQTRLMDGRTPDRYITLSAKRGQRVNWTNIRQKHKDPLFLLNHILLANAMIRSLWTKGVAVASRRPKHCPQKFQKCFRLILLQNA